MVFRFEGELHFDHRFSLTPGGIINSNVEMELTKGDSDRKKSISNLHIK